MNIDVYYPDMPTDAQFLDFMKGVVAYVGYSYSNEVHLPCFSFSFRLFLRVNILGLPFLPVSLRLYMCMDQTQKKNSLRQPKSLCSSLSYPIQEQDKPY